VVDNKFPWENPSSLQYSHPSVVRATFGAAVDKYIHQNMHDNCGHIVDGTKTIVVGRNGTRRRLATTSLLDNNGNNSSIIISGSNNDSRLSMNLPDTTVAVTTTHSNAGHCVPYDSFSYVASPGIKDVDIENDKDNEQAKLTHHAHAMMPLIPSVRKYNPTRSLFFSYSFFTSH
jgi:hypothetical protein